MLTSINFTIPLELLEELGMSLPPSFGPDVPVQARYSYQDVSDLPIVAAFIVATHIKVMTGDVFRGIDQHLHNTVSQTLLQLFKYTTHLQ